MSLGDVNRKTDSYIFLVWLKYRHKKTFPEPSVVWFDYYDQSGKTLLVHA